MKRWVRVSSSVDFTPSLAATMCCTNTFSCSSSALNPSSDLAKAYVSLPVVRLILVGGVTPRDSSTVASLGLLIRSSFSMSIFDINASFLAFTESKCPSRMLSSKSSTGSENIRMVRSISLSSVLLYPRDSILNSSSVRWQSFLQYSPYAARSTAVKSVRLLPRAWTTSVPFSPSL